MDGTADVRSIQPSGAEIERPHQRFILQERLISVSGSAIMGGGLHGIDGMHE